MLESFPFGIIRFPFSSIENLIRKDNQILGNLPPDEFIGKMNELLTPEAILIASKVLYDEISLNTRDNRKSLQTYESVYKYFIRSCCRATPYGLFAGCGTYTLNNKTRVLFDKKNKSYTKTRLDIDCQMEVIRNIIELYGLEQQLKYYPNTTIYSFNAVYYRYIEYILKAQKKTYKISSFKKNPAVVLVLNFAKKGKSFDQIANYISRKGFSKEETQDFLKSLINAQILVSELEVNVTGKKYFSVLLDILKKKPNCNHLHKVLSSVQLIIEKSNFSVNDYFEIEKSLSGISGKISSKNLLQSDLFYNVKASLASGSVQNISDKVKYLYKLGKKSSPRNLELFKQKFENLYEGRKIPLMQALDGETGIGYGDHTSDSYGDHTLLEKIYFKDPSELEVEFGKLSKFVLTKYATFLETGSNVLTLSHDELKFLEAPDESPKNIPSSFYVIGTLLASSSAEIDNNKFKFFLRGIGGPSAANLIGRFGNGGTQYENILKEICKKEDELYGTECVIAEVVHVPQGRIGNVVVRPKLRKYEIPYAGKSLNTDDDQIKISDLSVFLENKQLILYSERLKKRVIPRLSTAHNFQYTDLPLYRFLCDLQSQNIDRPFIWNWSFLSDRKHLPRIEFENLILSREAWRIDHSDLKNISNDQRYREVLINTYKLPRYFIISQHDNELLIDLDDARSLNILKKTIDAFDEVLLYEFIGNPEECFIDHKQELYTNEIIIPFYRTQKYHHIAHPIPTDDVVKRKFQPGEEWLYFKIYGGAQILDQLIVNELKSLTQALGEKELIKEWFFIRYHDPESHIRLRFRLADPLKAQRIIKLFNGAVLSYIKDETITKTQIDTYVRELERYGWQTIGIAERIFHQDSILVANLLSKINELPNKAQLRWLCGMICINAFLDDFSFDLSAKLSLIKTIRDGFFKEFNGDKSLKIQLDEDYRAKKTIIFDFMQKEMMNNDADSLLYEIKKRSKNNLEIIKEYQIIKSTDISAITITEQLPSYIHMHLNRLFTSFQRKQELVLYNLLFKYYESQMAISKRKLSPAETASQAN